MRSFCHRWPVGRCSFPRIGRALVCAGVAWWAVQSVAVLPAADDSGVFDRKYQEYRSDDLPTPSQIKILRGRITALLSTGTFENDDQKKDFEKFFRYHLAELTWEESIKDLPKKRDTLKKNYLTAASRAPEPAIHQELNKLMLAGLVPFATNAELHPASRLACVLLLGQLDQTEPDGSGKGAVALPAALDKLLAIAGDDKQLDAVRIGALVGVARHARSGMTPAGRKQTVDRLATKPLAGSSPTSTQWMQRASVRILGEVAARGSEGSTPAVAALTLAVLQDPQATEWSRCDAARTVGVLEKSAFTGSSPVNAFITEIAKLAVDICSNTADSERVYSAEVLASEFQQIRFAIKGLEGGKSGLAVAAATPAELKATVGELDTKIGELVEMSANARLQIDRLLTEVQSKGKSLQSWMASKNLTSGQVAKGQ